MVSENGTPCSQQLTGLTAVKLSNLLTLTKLNKTVKQTSQCCDVCFVYSKFRYRFFLSVLVALIKNIFKKNPKLPFHPLTSQNGLSRQLPLLCTSKKRSVTSLSSLPLDSLGQGRGLSWYCREVGYACLPCSLIGFVSSSITWPVDRSSICCSFFLFCLSARIWKEEKGKTGEHTWKGNRVLRDAFPLHSSCDSSA